MESKKKSDRKNRKLKKAEAFLALVKSNKESEVNTISINQGDNSGVTQKALFPRTSDIMKSPSDAETNNSSCDGVPGCEKKKYSDEAFNEMKKILRERNKAAMQRPKLFLTPDDMLPYKPSSDDGEVTVPPLYSIDLQHLLLYALQGNVCSFKPRWCKLLRVTKVSSVVVIFLDGVGYSDFTEDKESFKFISQSFDSHTEMVCPEQYNCSVDAEITRVPLSISQLKKANVKVQEDVRKEVADKIKPVVKLPDGPDEDKFSRVCLLLSSNQMKQEGYPLPVQTKNKQYNGFVFTKDKYEKVTPKSPLIAVDCEMCLTTLRKNELTRVSLVAENGETIYDTLVKPRNRIINYLTRFSGITREMMENVTKRIEHVHKDIKNILPPDAILCGQSLNCDLLALKLFHPYVIDTSVIFNMSGNRRAKAGLRKLTGFFLNRTIQNHAEAGHCSVEDAKATLDLVKLKLKKGLEFGDATISGVYFPNVQSYFLGKEGGKDGAVQNVETIDNDDSSPPPSSSPLSSGTTTATTTVETAVFPKEELTPSSSPLKRPHQEDVDDSNTNNTPKKIKLSSGDISPDTPAWHNSQRQMAMFNQNNSVHVSQSIFKLVEEAGRTGCLIGRESLISKYQKDPIEKCTAATDKEACKSAKQFVETKEFTWVNFNKFREDMANPDSTKEHLESVKRKLDRRVQKVLDKTKDKSLVMVVMTGRQTDKGTTVNAGTFVKITG